MGSGTKPHVTLFIVEDQPQMVELIRWDVVSRIDMLEFSGSAADAPAAIKAISIIKPEIILIDIFLANGTNGLEVLRAARHLDLAIRAVIVTNSPTAELADHAHRLGASHFIDKSDLVKLTEVLTELAVSECQRRKLIAQLN